jgi:hypothetical protein
VILDPLPEGVRFVKLLPGRSRDKLDAALVECWHPASLRVTLTDGPSKGHEMCSLCKATKFEGRVLSIANVPVQAREAEDQGALF